PRQPGAPARRRSSAGEKYIHHRSERIAADPAAPGSAHPVRGGEDGRPEPSRLLLQGIGRTKQAPQAPPSKYSKPILANWLPGLEPQNCIKLLYLHLFLLFYVLNTP